jgi:hypothetical protein
MTDTTPTPARSEDVEAHHVSASDENLKQAIAEVEGALAKLYAATAPKDDGNVEAHAARILSDEDLQQAVTAVGNALAQLRGLQASRTDDVEAHSARGFSHENIKVTIATLTDALEKLRAL